MKTKKVIVVMLVVIGVLLAWVSPALAMPPLPSSSWGLVRVANDNVPLGTIISAWINGVKYAEAPVILNNGDTYYSLDVPGDDSSTPGIEGGVQGDVIHFQIQIPGEEPIYVQATRTWQGGTNVQFPLVTGPSAIQLTNIRASHDNHLAFSMTLWVALIGIVALSVLGWTWWRKSRQDEEYR